MVVCSCNYITDKDIISAMAGPNPPRGVCEVYCALGCSPVCGGCAAMINRIMQMNLEGRCSLDCESRAIEKEDV